MKTRNAEQNLLIKESKRKFLISVMILMEMVLSGERTTFWLNISTKIAMVGSTPRKRRPPSMLLKR